MRPKLIVLTSFALLGLAVLLTLGFWQLERREWKHELIARIEARADAAPVGLSQAISQWQGGQDMEFLRVRLAGVLHSGKEIHYYNVVDGQLGWQVISPLLTDDGILVMVDRGFVPDRLKNPQTRDGARPAERVSLTGRARAPAQRGLFTPDNDPAANQWYWRDLDSMAAALSEPPRTQLAPFFVEAEAGSLPGEWPRSRSGVLLPTDRHLSYALTWFGLALTLILVYGALVRTRMKALRS